MMKAEIHPGSSCVLHFLLQRQRVANLTVLGAQPIRCVAIKCMCRYVTYVDMTYARKDTESTGKFTASNFTSGSSLR